tara:strand:+ start:383 stop:1060 length:678 start_codon:yes stop_codon:yes gene_type:complete
MKILLSIIILFVSAVAFAGNNDIYITQTGTGLTLTIDQIGATNKVGTSQARAILSGTSMTVDLDQIGDTNTISASILQGNSSSWTYQATGDSNVGTFAVGATGDVAGTDFDFAATGDSNVLTFTQGDAATATGGNQDFAITGTSNDINVKCNVVGCINSWTVSGNSNDIDTLQSGRQDHDITVALTGSSNNVDVDQTDTASTNVANIISTTTNGVINVDQCASGC